MGISFDMTNTDITPGADLKTGEDIRDHKAFIAYVKALLSSDPAKNPLRLCFEVYDEVWTMDKERSDKIPEKSSHRYRAHACLA